MMTCLPRRFAVDETQRNEQNTPETLRTEPCGWPKLANARAPHCAMTRVLHKVAKQQIIYPNAPK